MNNGPRKRKQLAKRYGCECLRCETTPGLGNLTLDHVLPRSHGGADDVGNLQLLCDPCNQWKGARMIDYRPALLRPAFT